MTVGEWAARWRRAFPRPSKATQRHNEQMVAPFVRQYGGMHLANVTGLCAAEWGSKHPGHVRYLRLFFADAVRAGVHDVNPFAGVAVKRSSGRANVAPPAEKQLVAIMHAAPGALSGFVTGWAPIFARMVAVAAFTGLRASELLALRMGDVVFVDPTDGAAVRVRQGKAVDGEARPRTALVLSPAEGALRRQLEERAAAGRNWWDPAPGDVRPLWWKPGRRRRDRGGRVSYDCLSRSWRACCSAAGVEFTWHQLRHFCATWLLDHGASDMDVAVQLGHFDRHGRPNPQLVRDLYGHVDHGAALDRLRALA